MNRRPLSFLIFLGILSVAAPLWADSDERGESEGWMGWFFEEDPHENGEVGEHYIKPITNQAYLTECGACHFAYQAELLPRQSWEKILGNLEEHFGDDALLESAPLTEVRSYLLGNAAETSRSGRSKKLIRSVQGDAPIRISALPYFKQAHHEISASVISRPSIKSFSNCSACHQRAALGVYSEDYISIPL